MWSMCTTHGMIGAGGRKPYITVRQAPGRLELGALHAHIEACDDPLITLSISHVYVLLDTYLLHIHLSVVLYCMYTDT